MDWKIIVILILLGYMVYWYTNPIQGKETLQSAGQKIEDFAMGKKAACSSNYDPVCADNTTYTNLCVAQKAGKQNVTMGVC